MKIYFITYIDVIYFIVHFKLMIIISNYREYK
jgi:hypothetical protein